MKRRMISTLLALALLLGLAPLFPLQTQAAEESETATGTCGENLTWVLDEYGYLTISGTGAMYDWEGETSPWSSFKDSISYVYINEGVTRIGNNAFYDCGSLSRLSLPDSLTSIGDSAFWFCTNLNRIDIPENVSSIGYGAFARCDYLEDVKIPDKVTRIEDMTFSDCTHLSYVSMSDNVTYLGKGAFYHCSNLIKAPLPKSIHSIEDGTFISCNHLENVVIPDGVSTIGKDAFALCTSLKRLSIPSSVTNIHTTAFDDSTSLTEIYFYGDAPSGIQASNDSTGTFPSQATLYYIDGKGGWSAPTWKGYPTKTWSGLNSPLDIIASGPCGENVTWILDNDGTLTISGSGAIDSRWSPMDVPWRNLRPLIKKAILEDGITNVAPYTFHFCQNLESVSIPNTVTTIGESGFSSCKSLKSISIPNTVTYIGRYAFSSCDSLTHVDIPDSVSTIDEFAFMECQKLRTISIPSSVTEMHYAINCCPSLTKISVDTQNKAYFTDENGVLFNKAKTVLEVFPSGSNLSFYEIPNSVTLIEYAAFYEANSLKTVTIPDSVIEIRNNAFSYCKGLESISIPDSVQCIGYDAFCVCKNLHSLIIGKGVNDIGMCAFSDCDNLSSIYFTGPAPKIYEASYSTEEFPTFPEDVTLRYVSGQSGWTSPSWNGFRTSTWSGNGSVNTVENNMILSLNESTSQNEYVLTGSLPDYGTSIHVFYALFNSDDQLLSFGEKTIPKEQEASFRATLSSAKEVDHMKIIVLDETSNTPLSPASLITLNKN